VINVARFDVHVADGLCAALDKACALTGASRSRVLAVLLRLHIQQLIGFLGDRLDTIDGVDEAVTVDELRDHRDTHARDANAKDAQELVLLTRALGLPTPPDC
jgi:hypothetical protein